MRHLLLSLLLSLTLSLPCWAGASRDFDGAGDFLTVTSNAGLKVGDGDLTIMFWMNPDSFTASYNCVFDKGTTDITREYSFFIDSTTVGFISLGHNNLGGAGLTFSPAVATGAWQHIAILRSGSAVTIYCNLTSCSTTTLSSTGTNDQNLVIGKNTSGGGSDWDGKLAHLSVYDRALSFVEITEEKSHPGTIRSGLQLYLPIFGSDSPELDLSGKANTGAVTNAVSSAEGPPIFLTSPQAWRHWFDRVLDWLVPSVFADDIVLCNPTDPTVPGRVSSYQRSADPFKSGATTNPNSLIWSLPASTVNPWDGVVPAAPQAYWKCSGSTVVEMSQAEKDALDAPALAEQARQQAFTDEQATNDLCTATLAELTDRINTFRDSVNTDIAAAANVAQLKTVMTTMNTTYAGAMKKIARCVRARSR